VVFEFNWHLEVHGTLKLVLEVSGNLTVLEKFKRVVEDWNFSAAFRSLWHIKNGSSGNLKQVWKG